MHMLSEQQLVGSELEMISNVMGSDVYLSQGMEFSRILLVSLMWDTRANIPVLRPRRTAHTKNYGGTHCCIEFRT